MSQRPPSSTQTVSNVFSSPNGLPLKVFIESNGIEDDRPKLIRTLKRNGAEVCREVATAQIILVNPDTDQGRRFAQTWASEPGKEVLDCKWAYKCVERGQALLKHDNWGGFNDLDDTIYESFEEEDGDASDVSEQSEHKPKARKRKRKPTSSSTQKSVRAASVIDPPAASTSSSSQIPSNTMIASESGSISHFSPSTPQASNPTTQHPPQLFQYGLPSFPFQQNYSFMGSNQWYPYAPPNTQAVVVHHPLSSSQGSLQFMPAMSTQSLLPPPPSQPMSFSEANHPAAQARMSNYEGIVESLDGESDTSPPPKRNINVALGGPMSISERVKTEKLREERSPRSSMGSRSVSASHELIDDGPDAQGLRREGEKSSNTQYSGLSNGARNSIRPKGQRNSINQTSTFDTAQSSSDSPLRSSQKPSRTGVFTTAEGAAMTFWVQPDMKDRKELLVLIRENGGRVTDKLEKATFIILRNRSGSGMKDRCVDGYLKTVAEMERTALKKDFIQACVEDDSIVDETPYHHNLPHKKRGRTREKKIAAKPRHSDCRSLSPFDGNSEVFGSYGSNYRFTRSEDEYAKKVVKHLIDREGDFDYGVLAEVVASRITVHPVRSWLHRLRYGNLALFVEDAKLEILRTSVKSCTPEGDTLLNDEGVERKASVASTATAVDAPAASPSISAEPDDSSFKSDFDRIVSFFRDAYVEVKGTQWNDEDLWDRLEGKYVCTTHPTWKDFYTDNGKAVVTRLEEVLKVGSG